MVGFRNVVLATSLRNHKLAFVYKFHLDFTRAHHCPKGIYRAQNLQSNLARQFVCIWFHCLKRSPGIENSASIDADS